MLLAVLQRCQDAFTVSVQLLTCGLASGQEEGTKQATQLCNPPMIHSLAAVNAREGLHGSLTAAARGDGIVAIYNIEDDVKSNRGRSRARAPSICSPIFASKSHDAAVNCV